MRTDVRPAPVAAPPPAERATDTSAGPSVVGALAAALGAALAGSPAAHGIPAPAVHPLGLRDELAVPGGDEPRAVHVYGHHALVGPFVPGGGPACARCLARRWQAVRARGLREALESGADTRAAGASPWQLPFAADALAAVLAAHTAAAAGTARERFPYAYLLDLETLGVTRFPVAPDAECPACGDAPPDTAPAAAVPLPATPKRSATDFRSRPADAYDVPLEVFVNPVAGMLGPSVVPDLVSASTSSTVGSFLLRSGDYLRECFWGGHTPRYRSSVRVGLLEGLERFAGMRPRGKRTQVVAAYDELARTAPVLDPRACGLYDAGFHRAEPEVRPFDPARPIPWVWGYSLRDHRPLLVPEITAYYHAPGGLANRFVQESSNGCASGGSWAEAVYFGLMEVIERDAFLLAWYGRAPLTEIDGSASRRPETRSMIDRLAMYGYRARFFDTRITFPVPVVTAVAERVDGGTGRLCFGAGASLDPEAALAAGLCEIATDAVNLRARTERDAPRLRAMAEDFTKVRVLHDHPLVYGLPEMARHADFLLGTSGRPGNRRPPRITPAALARDTVAPGDDLRDDVEACVAQVARAGFDVIAVDQTGPEQRALGFRTAGVIVPGLLPIDFGWNRQRARHMPRMRSALREAGLCERDLAADDLNPAPHPFP
ncbi:TOMM precursor leader peptide-binding protein [Streptomyces sp. NBC_00669]|uniref:TOMM precursor leader peptide-binding protein n=1 Tax=Streptomyces sp. NBC_00669 TaxID=2976011 RepID=UPI002E313A63|nr:TOMM precursor leader peptide-binding protein [Streptomyces sp. NBC_00669]